MERHSLALFILQVLILAAPLKQLINRNCVRRHIIIDRVTCQSRVTLTSSPTSGSGNYSARLASSQRQL